MTERYVKISSEEEIPFEFQGMVSFQITDGVIEAVVLKTEDGGYSSDCEEWYVY